MEARLAREATALLQCQHAGIATLHHVERQEIDGFSYTVMLEEFLPGGTLEEFKAAKPCETATVKQIGCRLADALGHLKQRCLVHRDVKPANILFRTPAEPVLSDFGIVRILGEPSLTHDFMMQGPGTPYYAAPEQLHNQKALIDWRTDQFCLGIVLAEWVLGHHPFAPSDGSQQGAVLAVAERKPLTDEVKKMLEERGLTPLVRALSPWPVERYRQPAEFIEALK